MSARPLWAPWRIEYIKGEKAEGCVFCRAAEGVGPDAELVVERGETCLALLNRFPYASGHVMVLPYRHVADLATLTGAELAETMTLARRITMAMQAAMAPEGFNLGLNLGVAAGAGIAEHLHLHVVPRWSGDTNFMPMLAGTAVMPQALEAARDVLRDALERLECVETPEPLGTTDAGKHPDEP